MKKYYTFNEDIVFRRVASRYDLDVKRLMTIIAGYVMIRHDVQFTIGLSAIAGAMEPFVKNELKPTIQELCRLYDSGPMAIIVDKQNRIRLYVDSSMEDDDGL